MFFQRNANLHLQWKQVSKDSVLSHWIYIFTHRMQTCQCTVRVDQLITEQNDKYLGHICQKLGDIGRIYYQLFILWKMLRKCWDFCSFFWIKCHRHLQTWSLSMSFDTNSERPKRIVWWVWPSVLSFQISQVWGAPAQWGGTGYYSASSKQFLDFFHLWYVLSIFQYFHENKLWNEMEVLIYFKQEAIDFK